MSGARAATGGFPYPHRTVAELPACAAQALCLTLDRVSTVPIVEGFGTDNCWQFLFIIPGDRQ